ncbi:F-box/LRR-repeat protein At3g26922-like [Salvia splendens]|uniref:F-box/LRR-repeat protein At3g26922-like n=1 Tax=Salvia splendens TaxID=180675 RepID=UPI001C27FCBC|nr:F-box/LRR-repeat protein At3g26922-like [Salvia splendens]
MVWLPGETRTWDEYKKKWIVVNDSNSKEKNNEEEDGKDWISELPDDMIIIILSLLPLREAGFTSVLSHRWSDLWKHIPNLAFAYYRNVVTMSVSAIRDMTPEKPLERVNSVLKLHQALSLKKFEICVYVDKSVQRLVTKWLKFVWSRNVEILNLNFICSDPEYRVVLGASLVQTRPTKYLKTLSLENIKVGGEDISLFLINCPLLSELNIKSSSVTSDLHVCGATLALKLLRIWECVYNNGSVVNISAPNLSQVDVDERIGKLLIENVPRLVVASFNIEGQKYTVHKFASAVHCFTSNLNTLILYLLYPKNILGKGFPQMPNLKELIVIDESGLFEHDYLLPAPYVIAACPRLQSATFKMEERKLKYVHTNSLKP